MPCGLINILYVKGYAQGPQVILCDLNKNQIDPPSLVFSDCEVGSSVSQTIYLCNTSSVVANYHFQCEKSGVFNIQQNNGVLQPKLNTPINIRFHPLYPGNYYRRLYIFIENQTPIYIDAIGTSYNEESRPQPLTYNHILNYFKRREAGYLYDSPAEIDAIMNEQGEQALYKPNEELIKWRKLLCNTGTLYNAQEEIINNIFVLSDNKDEKYNKEITINKSSIDFGQCIRSHGMVRKEITVTNNTEGKVLFWWRIPDYDKTDKYQTENEFQISPSVAEIEPHKTIQFRIMFKPGRDNFYYCRELEGYATFKINRNFRLVNDSTLSPSWMFSIRTSGHTFLPHIEHYLPKTNINMSPPDIIFAPCYVGETVYQTTKVINEGETPLVFDIDIKNYSNIFKIYPEHGLIPAGEFQIFLFSFSPAEDIGYNTLAHVLFNREENYSVTYSIRGLGALPSVEFSDDKEIYFKPTYIGLSSEKVMQIHNTSRIPILLQMQIPKRLDNIITLKENELIINGNDTIEIPWKFIPKEKKKYSGIVDCTVSNINFQTNSRQNQTIVILGEGSTGALQFDPIDCDLGPVVLNGTTHKKISLCNSSDCGLNYILSITPNEDDNGGDYIPTGDEERMIMGMNRKDTPEILLNPSKGFIEARSTITVEITFKPVIQREYKYKISWKIDMGDGNNNEDEINEGNNNSVCNVIGKCTIPLLEIQDIRCPVIPTHRLWNSFEILPFNTEMSKLLTSFDIDNNNTTGLAQTTLALKEFNFTFDPSPINSDPIVISVLFHNYGDIPLNYHLKLPNEVSVELENWDDGAEPTQKEQVENLIIDKQLFDISPRQGTLKPNESVIIKFTYRFISLDFDGKHDLPVVLYLRDGKQVRLWLHGHTLNNNESMLFVDNKLFSLYPIPIGQMDPNRQVYYLYNSSHCNIQYTIDSNVFKDYANENFDQYVYNIENKEGVVSAHSYYPLSILFHPLEAKNYKLKVPIMWHGIESEYQENQVLELLLDGNGIIPSVHRSLQDPNWYEPPIKPQFELINDLVTLSTSVINLHKVPVGGIMRHIVIMTNNCKNNAVKFQWELGTNLLPYEALSLTPMNGTIQPGQFTILTITFKGMGNYSHLIQNLTCNVIKDTSNEKSKAVSRPKHESVVNKTTKSILLRQEALMKDKTIKAQLLMNQTQIQYERAQIKDFNSASDSQMYVYDPDALTRFQTLYVKVIYEVWNPQALIEYNEGEYESIEKYYNEDKTKNSAQPIAASRPGSSVVKQVSELQQVSESCRTIANDLLSSTLMEIINDSQLVYTYEHRVKPKAETYLQFSSEKPTPISKTPRNIIKPTDTPTALCDPLCQTLLFDIFDNTMQNLIKENLKGDYNLMRKPRVFMKLE